MAELKVRYAVVGLGNIAQRAVLPAFAHAKANSELAALVSSDPEKREKLSKRYGVQLTGSYEDLERLILRGDIHAVYVAVPNSLHRDVAERAMRAGAHVLCEKPIATTEDDCRSMMGIARERGVKLMVAYRLHFEGANLSAIERVRAGEIGKPHLFSSVLCQTVEPGDVRTRDDLGGGALFDLGIYCINAARNLFQDEPVEVFGQRIASPDRRFREVDETTMAILRFPADRLAQFMVSQGSASVSEFRVVGTKGDIRLDPAFEYSGELREHVTLDGQTQEKTYGRRDQFGPEIVYFSRCILEGLDPEPSAEEGLADVRIIQAIMRSCQTGAVVRLPFFVRTRRPSASQQMSMPAVRKVEPIHAPPPTRGS